MTFNRNIKSQTGRLMLRTHPDGDASVECWSNKVEFEGGVLSGKVAFAFKTAVVT